MGYPSLGSWVTYGLGSESENLPAYVVMTQPEGTPEGVRRAGARGSCRRHHQGTLFRSGPAPIVNLKPPAESSLDRAAQDARPARSMNEQDLDPADTELSARIATYELAFRMQSEAPEAVDLSRESAETKRAVRPGRPPDGRVRHAMPAGPAAGRARASGSSSSIPAAARSPCSGTPTTTSTPTTRRCAA